MASTYKGTFPKLNDKPLIIECTRSVDGMRRHGLLAGKYVLRFKNEDYRYRMCCFARAAVSNKKIDYSNYPKLMDRTKKIGYNLAKIRNIKTTANCSNFIDAAVGAVSGKFIRDLGAKGNAKRLRKTKLFRAYKYKKAILLPGDICGTTKHTWMIIRSNMLAIGSQGTNVRRLQHFLNWFGGYGLATDSDFGPKTLAAVKDFQRKTGITVDGIFGKGSLAKAKAVKR